MYIKRARVIDIRDPKNIGRVKARFLEDTEEDQPNEILYWINPINTLAGYDDSGSSIVPPVGSIIFVLLEDSDYYKPYYLGGWQNSKTRPKEATDLRKRVLYKSPTGHTIYMDDTQGSERLRVIDRLGQIIDMYSPSKEDVDRRGLGNVVDGGAKSIDDTPDQTAAITIKGLSGDEISILTKKNDNSVNIICSGTVNLLGKEIKLNNGEAGIHTSSTNPFDFFTGRPFPGLPNVKAP